MMTIVSARKLLQGLRYHSESIKIRYNLIQQKQQEYNEYKRIGLPQDTLDIVAKLIEETNMRINDERQQVNSVLDIINRLEPQQRQLLIRRYVVGLTIEQIAEETNYSTGNINRLLCKALTAFAEAYGNNKGTAMP